MPVIDLNDERTDGPPVVGMVTRFPPSESGSAPAAWNLSDVLTRRFGQLVEVIRLVGSGESAAAGHPVIMDLNARWHMSARLAAERVNRCDVALVQVDRHVPLALIDDLLSALKLPVILWVDDVGSDETRRLGSIARKASITVVPSETARHRLESEGLDRGSIEVIAHGSPLHALAPNAGPRRQILSWGFVAPGFGAERIIRALPRLADLDPAVHYRLLGVTDPGWTRRESGAYRSSLLEEAERLGVADHFEMIPLQHSEDDLEREIRRCDVIAVVYDSRNRAASRILTEAVSTGRPVVATAFPGAVELLSSGAGLTFAHDDDQELADALRTYLTDDEAYRRSVRLASWLSPRLGFDEMARRLSELISRLLSQRLSMERSK